MLRGGRAARAVPGRGRRAVQAAVLVAGRQRRRGGARAGGSLGRVQLPSATGPLQVGNNSLAPTFVLPWGLHWFGFLSLVRLPLLPPPCLALFRHGARSGGWDVLVQARRL